MPVDMPVYMENWFPWHDHNLKDASVREHYEGS